MQAAIAVFCTLIVLLASAMIPTSLGTGAWLLGTLPLSPVIYRIFRALVLQVHPLERGTATAEPADRPTISSTIAASPQWNVITLVALVCICGFVFFPAPKEVELKVLEGRLTRMAWTKVAKGNTSFVLDLSDESSKDPIAKHAYFVGGWVEPLDIIGRLQQSHDRLIGEHAVIAVYPDSNRIFALRIADETVLSSADGVARHWQWRLLNLAGAVGAMSLWLAGILVFRRQAIAEAGSGVPKDGHRPALAGGLALDRRKPSH